MTTDRIATLDEPWPGRSGWLQRLAGALGRMLGRRPSPTLEVDGDADGDGPAPPPRPAPRARTRGKRRSAAGATATQPIDTADLIDAAPRATARAATHHPPPPPRAATSPGVRLATAAAELAPGEFDPLDALITILSTESEDELPPAPTADELGWIERLEPLIEYELMTRGGTAITFQGTAGQLAELVALTDEDFNAAVRVVSRDPAVAAAVLSAANSASTRRGADVADIRTAIARLGLPETRRLGIATATRAMYEPEGQGLARHHRARTHRDLHRAMTSAFASAALSARVGGKGADDAFVGGMFHDLGRPLIHRALIAVERRGRVPAIPEHVLDVVIERAHAEVGAEVLGRWGLPRRLSDLARYHLEPSPPPGKDGDDLRRLALVSSLVQRRVGALVPLAAARRAVALLELDRTTLRAIALEVHELAHKVSELFGVRDGATTWGGPDFER